MSGRAYVFEFLAGAELHVLGGIPILVVDVAGDPGLALPARADGPLDPEELVGERWTRLLAYRRLHPIGGLGARVR